MKKESVFMEFATIIRGILEILLVVLIVLKLYGLIATSWLWVLAPFWIPLIIAIPAIITHIYRIYRMKKMVKQYPEVDKFMKEYGELFKQKINPNMN